MSMLDFASALQGGPPPGAGPGGPGGDPGGGPGGADPQNLDAPPPDPSGAPPDMPEDGSLFQNSMEALDVAEEAIHAFIRMDPDEVDRAAAGQALTVILKLKASNQKSSQAGDAKSLQRALSGAPGLPGMGG